MDVDEGCFYTVCTKSSDAHLCKHCMQDASCQRADDNFFGIFHLGMNERYVPHFWYSLYKGHLLLSSEWSTWNYRITWTPECKYLFT